MTAVADNGRLAIRGPAVRYAFEPAVSDGNAYPMPIPFGAQVDFGTQQSAVA